MDAELTTQEELWKNGFIKLHPVRLPRELLVIILEFYIPPFPPFNPDMDGICLRYMKDASPPQVPQWFADPDGEVRNLVRQLIQWDALQQIDFCSGGATFLMFMPRKACSTYFQHVPTTFLPNCHYATWCDSGEERMNPFTRPKGEHSSFSLEIGSCSQTEPVDHCWPVLNQIRTEAQQRTKLHNLSIISSRSLFLCGVTQVLYDGIASSFRLDNSGGTRIVVSYLRRDIL